MWIKKSKQTNKVIPPIVEKTMETVNEGFPVKKVIVKEKVTTTNSYEVWSKQPTYNADALEISIATGVDLKQVNSKALNPDHIEIDTYELDNAKDVIKNNKEEKK